MDPIAPRRLGRTDLLVTHLGCGGAAREVVPEGQSDVTLQGVSAAGVGGFAPAPARTRPHPSE